MADPAGLVSIIILNWNGCQDTIECVESCRKLSYENFRILIVDNGSTDGSEAILRERYPDIKFLQTGSNLGFAGGNNAGIRYALDQGAAYVWLLNNDTIVDPDALTALVLAAETDPKIGMAGSKIYYHDAPDMLWYAGGMFDPARPHRLYHLGIAQRDCGGYDELCDTGFVTGCSLLAKRELVEAVGLLEEGFFLYFEDTDWNARARRAGWRTIYCPASRIFHKVSVSMGGAEAPVQVYYTARNVLYFVRRNFPGKLPGAFVHAVYEHVLVNLKKGRLAHARNGLRGIVDFLLRRMGPAR